MAGRTRGGSFRTRPGIRRTGQRKVARRSAAARAGNFHPTVRLNPNRVRRSRSPIRAARRGRILTARR